MELTQWLSLAIVIAILVLLCRQTSSRIDRLGDQVNQVSGRIDRPADIVATTDRRLASLEGRITGWQDRQHGPAA